MNELPQSVTGNTGTRHDEKLMTSWELSARMIPKGAIRKTGKVLRSLMLCKSHIPGSINVGAISDPSSVSSILKQ
jgi:hypothetical protein